MRKDSSCCRGFLTATLALAGGLVATLAPGCAQSATPHPFGAAGPSPTHVTPPRHKAALNIAPVPPPPTFSTSTPDGIHGNVLDVGGRDLVFVTVDGSGAASTPDQPPEPVAPARDVTVVVKPGQTLFAIAREHLGSGARWRELVAANPGLDPLTLRAGQEIRIP